MPCIWWIITNEQRKVLFSSSFSSFRAFYPWMLKHSVRNIHWNRTRLRSIWHTRNNERNQLKKKCLCNQVKQTSKHIFFLFIRHITFAFRFNLLLPDKIQQQTTRNKNITKNQAKTKRIHYSRRPASTPTGHYHFFRWILLSCRF